MAKRRSMKIGGGARFSSLKEKLAGEKGIRHPGALAAAIGRKKYGKVRFAKMGARGRKRRR